MIKASTVDLTRRVVKDNVWLARAGDARAEVARLTAHELRPEVLDSEAAVGRAMFGELESAAQAKDGDLAIALLGGRGAQALHRLLGKLARASEHDELLSRLHVFTQDSLAPMRAENGLSFVRDFERLLGREFFQKVALYQ